MKLKKALAIILTLAMVLALAACGATTAQETQAPETAAPAADGETAAAASEPVNIVWAGWSGEEESAQRPTMTQGPFSASSVITRN